MDNYGYDKVTNSHRAKAGTAPNDPNGFNRKTPGAGQAGTGKDPNDPNGFNRKTPPPNQSSSSQESKPTMFMDRYRVIKELGRGGMGVVYLCIDEQSDNREVALKTLPPELSRDRTAVEGIRANFKLVCELNHPNIAASHQIEQDPVTGDCYIIMEYVNGESLRTKMNDRHLKKQVFSLAEAVPILRQIAAALDFAHGEKIVHRDIKPENVMVDLKGRVKVLDFGLAERLHSSNSIRAMAFKSQKSEDDGLAGTAAYMAPEQWNCEWPEAPTDQYALAVTAYEMLAGYVPFDGPPSLLKDAVLNNAPKPVDGLSSAPWKALAKALSKKPEDRFTSCTEFVDALEGGKSKFVASPRVLVIGAAVLLAVVLGLWGIFSEEPTEAGESTVKITEVKPENPPKPEVSEEKTQQEKGTSDAGSGRVKEEDKGAKDAQLMQEVYNLQATLKTYNDQLAQSPLDRGQTFGKHIDSFTQNYTSAEGVMVDANNSQRFTLANKWYQTAKTEAEWLSANTPKRTEAKTLLAEADAACAQARKDGAETLGKVSFDSASAKLRQAKADFEAGKFDTALASGKSATDGFKESGAQAIRSRVDSFLAAGRLALGAKRWEDAVKQANEALALDAGNAEAKQLKSEAERNLRPSVEIYAQLDGETVVASIDKFTPAHSGRTDDGAFLLEKGKAYDLHLTYQKDGNTYEGSLAFTAGWNGLQRKTVSLKNSFNGTITLPGNVKLELVKIQAGRFQMGSPTGEEGRYKDETQHWVTLTRDYWLGAYEVTQAQYKAVMKDNPSNFKGDDRPVEEVTWDQAKEFCDRLNAMPSLKRPDGYKFSLPTEAQWEYAARGGNRSKGYNYSGSDNVGQVAWYEDNSGSSTHPVGQKTANELGLYDMSGNVWEWCLDQCEYQNGVVTDTYKDNIRDPLCRTGSKRVCRGGGWHYFAWHCRAANRVSGTPGLSSYNLGFRLALVPAQ